MTAFRAHRGRLILLAWTSLVSVFSTLEEVSSFSFSKLDLVLAVSFRVALAFTAALAASSSWAFSR